MSGFFQAPNKDRADLTIAQQRILELEAQNSTLRNAQKACETCDGPTMERLKELEAALAEQQASFEALSDLYTVLQAEQKEIRKQLKGHPDSKLGGEGGLAAATMRLAESRSVDDFMDRLFAKLQSFGYDVQACDGDEDEETIIATWFKAQMSEFQADRDEAMVRCWVQGAEDIWSDHSWDDAEQEARRLLKAGQLGVKK